ncbi:hypothetical protein LY76DRAFT_56271 [Colletotrichum caudatum]|nr:hypothetical protein LY76DRAFT_56271 [Colletotrichum caudatum]
MSLRMERELVSWTRPFVHPSLPLPLALCLVHSLLTERPRVLMPCCVHYTPHCCSILPIVRLSLYCTTLFVPHSFHAGVATSSDLDARAHLGLPSRYSSK